MRKCTKAEKLNPLIALTRRSIRSGLVDRFVGTRDLKRLLHVVFSTILLHFFRAFHISDSKDQFKQSLDRLKAFDWIFWRIGGQGFGFGLHFLPLARHNQGFLISHAPRVLVVSVFLSTSLVSFIFVFLMAHRRESGTSKAQGKRPAVPSQLPQLEARRKARFDTTIFSSVEDYQLYKQKFAQRKVVPRRSINFPNSSISDLRDCSIGWVDCPW